MLEELEEELHHRSTKRAKQLLIRVEKSLVADTSIREQPHTKERNPEKQSSPQAADISKSQHLDNDDPIDWDIVLSDTSDQVSNANTTSPATGESEIKWHSDLLTFLKPGLR
ncbi:MAG: hypothetical protein ABW201_18455 [Candidatus Thiodiazotropha sp.]